MEQFNKALSFILGLVVVAVFIIVASGKFNNKGVNTSKPTPQVTVTPKPTSKPWFSFWGPTATPTMKPTNAPTVTPKAIGYTYPVNQTQQATQQIPSYNSYTGNSNPTSIPNTGIPIVLFPLFGTSLLTGIFMKKTGKRD